MPWQTSSLLSFGISFLLRSLACTWRIRVRDESGIFAAGNAPGRVIWIFWHNRLLVIPVVYERFFSKRKSAVLISRSRDGAILAGCIKRFGGEPVRGSTSSGGATVLRELERKMAEGYDVYITPDGPRGPRYSVGPGALWLAEAAAAPILPVHVECSRFWRLGRWDGFIIPKPFAHIEVTFEPLHWPAKAEESQL